MNMNLQNIIPASINNFIAVLFAPNAAQTEGTFPYLNMGETQVEIADLDPVKLEVIEDGDLLILQSLTYTEEGPQPFRKVFRFRNKNQFLKSIVYTRGILHIDAA